MPGIFDEWFSEQLFSFLDELLHRQGFRLPIQFVVLGANGSAYVGTFEQSGGDGLTPIFTGQHLVEPGFALPANVVFIDADGDAARLLIRGPDVPPKWMS